MALYAWGSSCPALARSFYAAGIRFRVVGVYGPDRQTTGNAIDNMTLSDTGCRMLVRTADELYLVDKTLKTVDPVAWHRRIGDAS